MCPNKMAVQMSAGRRPRVAWNSAHSPSGTTIWDTIEMYSGDRVRSEEHTSELQSRLHLVCRLLLEKKKKIETYWYQVWMTYPAGMLTGSRLLDASPHKVN